MTNNGLNFVFVIINLLIILNESIKLNEVPSVPQFSLNNINEDSSNVNVKANDLPPINLFNNIDENTNSPVENTRPEDKDNSNSKSSKKIDGEDLKGKLSSLIEKEEKIKNKDYKSKFISYILSYENKKLEYDDYVNNGKNDKIKEKYDLFVESDLYINKLNENLEYPIYNHTTFSDYSMDEKKALLIDETEMRRRLALQSCTSFSGWGSGSTIYKEFSAYAQPIQNQGSCGSCWAFASAAQYELNYYLYKNIKQKQSEQYILDCVGDAIGNCVGGWPTDTNRWLGTYGSCPSSSYYSYDGKDTWSCSSCWGTKTPVSKTACINQASTGYSGTSLGFWNIVVNTAEKVGLTYWMGISNNFYYLSSSYPYLYSCDSSNIIGYHAMAIYGESYGNWLYIKNQWGTGWGNNGWFWLNYAARTSCNFQADVSFNYW